VTVTVSAVIVAVLFKVKRSSLNHGLACPTEGVAVTVPPPPPLVTVSATVVVRDSVPDVPVMVTVAAPSVAVLDAVKVAVTELPVVAVDGLNATVTPAGRPVAVNPTAPVKLVRLMAIVVPALAPRATETGAAAPIVKSAAAFTVSDTLVVRDNVPEVAVISTLAVPSVAVLEAVNVATTELPVVADEGLNATVTPLGKPLALMDTAPVKLVRVIAIVEAALAPRATPNVAGDAATL
jgi:hypothetical protein